MTQHVVVVGAGGFGRETLDVIEAVIREGADLQILGVIDDTPSESNLARLSARGVAYLGASEPFLARAPRCAFVVAIGDPEIRQRIAYQWEAAEFTAATLIHPRAGIGSRSVIDVGTVVCAGVQVSTNVRLGRHVHVNPNATIGHDTVVANFVSVNPAAIISGDVVVRERSLIGAGAVVLQGLEVGASAVVGAAACVTRDVAAGAVAVGVPAR